MTRWATFDCFGTLIDWRHGIASSAELLWPGRGQDVLDAYHRHEAAVQCEKPDRRYRDVLAETLRRSAAELNLDLIPDDATVLAATIPYWPVLPDTRPALTDLRAAGWRLALLTNCDRDIIAHTQRRLRVPIHVVITAEDVARTNRHTTTSSASGTPSEPAAALGPRGPKPRPRHRPGPRASHSERVDKSPG